MSENIGNFGDFGFENNIEPIKTILNYQDPKRRQPSIDDLLFVEEVRTRIGQEHIYPTETVAAAQTRVTLAERRTDEFAKIARDAGRALERANERIDTANATIRRQNQALEELRRQLEASRVDSRDSLGYFKSLGLAPSAFEGLTEEQIMAKLKANYRVDSMRAHPDRGGSVEDMARINAANDVLSDPLRRQSYLNRTGEFDPRRRR